MSYNDRSPPPVCLPSRLPDVTHVTLSPRPSPSVFAYSMRSKTGSGNGLGTRLTDDCVTHKLVSFPDYRRRLWCTAHASCSVWVGSLGTRLLPIRQGPQGLGLASYPGSCGGGEKRAWYRPFAHALNYKLKNHVFVANDV